VFLLVSMSPSWVPFSERLKVRVREIESSSMKRVCIQSLLGYAYLLLGLLAAVAAVLVVVTPCFILGFLSQHSLKSV
jgi:hypothetical protein